MNRTEVYVLHLLSTDWRTSATFDISVPDCRRAWPGWEAAAASSWRAVLLLLDAGVRTELPTWPVREYRLPTPSQLCVSHGNGEVHTSADQCFTLPITLHMYHLAFHSRGCVSYQLVLRKARQEARRFIFRFDVNEHVWQNLNKSNISFDKS